MIITELFQEVAENLHDPMMERVDADRLLVFLNNAARDVRNEGWYLPMPDDTSITLVADTFEYTVPDNFAYIYEIRLENATGEDVFDRFIPLHFWVPTLNDAGIPVIRFYQALFDVEPSARIMLRGQKRPSTYSWTKVGAVYQSIDNLLESFLRERTLCYAARFLARGGEALDGQNSQLSAEAFAISERLLRSHPQSVRMKPNSRVVPGR